MDPAWAFATSFPGTGGKDGERESGMTDGRESIVVGRESIPVGRASVPVGRGTISVRRESVPVGKESVPSQGARLSVAERWMRLQEQLD